MTGAVLDTHKIYKSFINAGFSEHQAEAQTETAKIVFDAAVEKAHEEVRPHEFATVFDLKDEIQKVNLTIEKTKSSILLWVFGITFAQTSLIFGFFGIALNLF